MDAADLERPDGPDADDESTDRREFLRRFASMSVAAVLLGASTGCIPDDVYGPAPVYGPPDTGEETSEDTEPLPEAVYGPPPTGESPDD